MPVEIDPLIATFIKLHLRASAPNPVRIRRLGTIGRPPRYKLQPPYKTYFFPSLTSIPSYNLLRRSHSLSLNQQTVSTYSCAVKLLDSQLKRCCDSRAGTFNPNLGSSIQSNPHSRLQQNGLGSWTIAIVLATITGAFLLQPYYPSIPIYLGGWLLNPLNCSDSGSGKEIKILLIEDWSKMHGEEPPGRPGNLTPEQEEKLKEIWIATLQVFGVLDSQRPKEANGAGLVGTNPASDTTTSEKPKKRRLAIFGRKHKDSDTDSITSTDSTSPALIGDSEDKYGQTKQFQDTLAQQSPQSLRAAFWSMVKHDHPDALLLRFLRARKWDVEKALVMMVSTMYWRAKEMHVDDDIMKSGEEGSLLASQSPDLAIRRSGEDFLAQMRMGKSFLHGVDKSGRPMCFVRVRLHKQGEQNEESLERYTVFVIESARMVLAPPVDTAVSLHIRSL